MPVSTATPRQQDAPTRATNGKLRVVFGMRETARLSGISYWTLRHWYRKGWIVRANGGLSAWTVVALTILNSSGRGRGHGSYLGDVAVRRAVELVSDLDAALLLGEDAQDPYVAEVAAAIAAAALPSVELSPEVYDSLARVLEALDAKVATMRPSRL